MSLGGCRWVMIVAAVMFIMSSWAAESVSPKKSTRLRFKDGPVCMCVNGLSESQIRAANKARQAGKGASLPSIAPSQPNREENDLQKAGGR